MTILAQQRQNNCQKYLRTFKKEHLDTQQYAQEILRGRNNCFVNAVLTSNNMRAYCASLVKRRHHPTQRQGEKRGYEPTIVVGTHTIKKEQKLELFFVSYVLEHLQPNASAFGYIVGFDGKSHRIQLANSTKTLTPLLVPLQEWSHMLSPEEPPPILNKHCVVCQFRFHCQRSAKQEDHLSLLDRISTPKALHRYEKKGIFTVKQLSYTFKLRKRKKRSKNPQPITYNPELQALAIREQKIYIHELPKLSRACRELFLDIEGIPDQHFYYLIGLLVCEGEAMTYCPFWANAYEDEARVWQQFLKKLDCYPDTLVYHYGNFEPRTLAKLAKRYGTDITHLTDRLINVNAQIFGKVYFPTYSNGLKEIGHFLGVEWTAPDASGIQSLVWRHRWEETENERYRRQLMSYNQEDCQALKVLTDKLSTIKDSANALSEVDFANQPKHRATTVGKQIHSQFESILKFAHANYYKRKFIRFRQEHSDEQEKKHAASARKTRKHGHKAKPRAKKITHVPSASCCHWCQSTKIKLTQHISRKLIVDFVLTKSGIRKTITQYLGAMVQCLNCRKFSIPPALQKYTRPQLYGHGFKAWHVYQRVALRLPYDLIAESAEEQFHEKVHGADVARFINEFGLYYGKAEQLIIQHLLQSPFMHVDETPINIRGVSQYVWVFTNGQHVVFKLRESREANIVHEFLADYDGILISDFYSGYDAVTCRQQKCWPHLIRDLNDDLWASPFDIEFERFIAEVRDLIIPIMADVQKYGAKKYHLNKFMKSIETFYDCVITDKYYKSEVTTKYQKRFARYRESLFTFLQHDGIPWHNNTAETALRHLTTQEQISGTFHEATTHNYLVLLGIRQACRFQGESFFKFLFSEELYLEHFKERK
jgi:predicted RecB family nuclease